MRNGGKMVILECLTWIIISVLIHIEWFAHTYNKHNAVFWLAKIRWAETKCKLFFLIFINMSGIDDQTINQHRPIKANCGWILVSRQCECQRVTKIEPSNQLFIHAPISKITTFCLISSNYIIIMDTFTVAVLKKKIIKI